MDCCILDAFPESMPTKEIVALLSAVGFASPPAWLRPFHVLSTGQQFRVTLALLLASESKRIVFDEYTSVVDRTVAQIGSAALAKTVRQRGQQFVAVTCHEDVSYFRISNTIRASQFTRFSRRSAMLCYSYIRFSSDRQKHGDSYRRQTEMTQEWCAKHGHTLASENYEDLGVSGWTGENWREGGLSLFLEAVRKRKIKAGSMLIVENLDRLSRDEIDKALTVFCDILRAGITIVTLSPERTYTNDALSNPTTLIEAILGFILSNEESSKKSKRLKDLWAKKRRTATTDNIGGLCPAWIAWGCKRCRAARCGCGVEKSYHVIKDKADVVRMIFKMSADGLGSYQIIRELHAKQIGSIGRGGKWNHSYISLLLHHRGVIGERVLYKNANGKRIPDVTIPKFYPPIVDKATFYKVQSALAVRDKKAAFRGRGARNCRNLFSGLLVDVRDGGSLVYYQQYKPSMPKIWKYVVSHNAMRRVPGSCSVPYPYEALETAILVYVVGLTRADFFQTDEIDDSTISEKEGELAELNSNITIIKKRIMDGANAASLVSLLEDLDAKAIEKAEQLETAKAGSYKIGAVDVDELGDELKTAKGKKREEVRARLQGRLRTLIDRVYVLLSKKPATSGKRGNPWDKYAFVEIRSRNGAYSQVMLSYIGGEPNLLWVGKIEPLQDLVKDIDVTDPSAMVPIPNDRVVGKRKRR